MKVCYTVFMMTKEERRAYDQKRRETRVARERERRFVARMKELAAQAPPVPFVPEPMGRAAAPAVMMSDEERAAKWKAGRANIEATERMNREFEENLRRTDPHAWAAWKTEQALYQPGVLQEVREEYDVEHAGETDEDGGTIETMPGYAAFYKMALDLNAQEQTVGA